MWRPNLRAQIFTPGPFPWTSPEVLVPILISPWLAAVLALALVPVGLPDAAKQVCSVSAVCSLRAIWH